MAHLTSISHMQLLTARPLSSVAMWMGLLNDSNDSVRVSALQRLYSVIDHYWHEIAEILPELESITEELSFPDRKLASIVVSKCYFHLEQIDDALRYALEAGNYFNLSDKSEFTSCLIAECVEIYCKHRVKIADQLPGQDLYRQDSELSQPSHELLDPKLESIIETMFDDCFVNGAFTQAMGVALEARRLDKIKETISRCPDRPSLLAYTFSVTQATVSSRSYRLRILSLLVDEYNQLSEPDWPSMCQCYQFLNDPDHVALSLVHLMDHDEALMAYQICFDIMESENQGFVSAVLAKLPARSPSTQVLHQVLSDGLGRDLQLYCLHSQCHTDDVMLNQLKDSTANESVRTGASAILHHALVVSHGYMNCGTCKDDFLRKNLDWFGKASNWSKFSSVASLGAVHKGHVSRSMEILGPYLPNHTSSSSSSSYSEGGSLFALGLIHAGQESSSITQFLQDSLRNAGNREPIVHGSCLGLGLVCMASGNMTIFEELKGVLFMDSAVNGEAAALAIGLVMLGSSSSSSDEVVRELLAYAHDTQHEKMIRAIGLALGMMVYGLEEAADVLIEQLSHDRDAVIRYGAMFAIGLAYAGSSNVNAVQRLLHHAVSDVNDDVRRVAVVNLGLILFKSPDAVPRLTALLIESFNPHVRYGACIAIALSCANHTTFSHAFQLLEPLLKDAIDLVRHGAAVAIALLLMEVNEVEFAPLAAFRSQLQVIISSKKESVLAKQGAIMAMGILNAGGRNSVFSLQSRAGFLKTGSIVGLVMWLHGYYWHPCLHFLNLSFSPSVIVGLTTTSTSLVIPRSFSLSSNCKRSLFAYPSPIVIKKDEDKQVIAKAVLSTTARAKQREALKEGKGGSINLLPDDNDDKKKKKKKGKQKNEADVVVEVTASAMTPVEDEPETYSLNNPDRIPPHQETFLELKAGQRYKPVKNGKPVGIVILQRVDGDETEDEDVIKPNIATIGIVQEEEDAVPPEPFDWTPPA